MSNPDKVRPDLLEDGDFPVSFGRYELLGLLGDGGMARVFRAELKGPRGFRKKAAVKVIRAALGGQNEQLTRALIHEARLGGLLHHPNVVETYDFGELDGQAWIAMELVTGIGLDRLLSIREPVPPPVALEITAQICGDLAHAHELADDDRPAPLVHRDLKPSNVMISDSGLVKVLDFGIAKATHISGNTTETGLTKGTPAYMSPEQAAGEEVDPRSDLFAVGALLYELLTGKRFFAGDTVFQIMMNVVRVEQMLEDPARLEAVEEACPGAGAVVMRSLRAHREDRYTSAREMEHAVRAMQGPVQAPGPIKRWLDERKATGDSRFTNALVTPSGGPEQLRRRTADLEELSLESATATPVAPEPTKTPDPTVPMTRQTPPPLPPPRRSRWPLVIGVLAVIAFLLSIVTVVVLLDGDGDGPQADADGLKAAATGPGGDAPLPPAPSLSPTPPVAEVAGATPATAASPTPVATPAPTPEATPTPRPEPATPGRAVADPVQSTADPTPAAAPTVTARLEHTPPRTVVIGTPTVLTVQVDPPDACRPTLAWAPWDRDDGGWQRARMTGTGDGAFEVDLFLPYEVAWRSGFRYQIRCNARGERVATWPASGSHKVPSLAR